MRAALAGGGIALQPTYLVNPYLRSGELQAVLPEWDLPVMTIYALYPSRGDCHPPCGRCWTFWCSGLRGAVVVPARLPRPFLLRY